MYQDAVKQLADAANVTMDHVVAILRDYIPDDANLTFSAPTSVHANFGVRVATAPYLGNTIFDDQIQVGYNWDGINGNEPHGGYVFEADYPINVRGQSNIRTMESYLEFMGAGAGSGALTQRPWFWSFAPQVVAGAAPTGDGFINYGYLMTGSALASTSGGGGLAILKGDDAATNSRLAVFDTEGCKLTNLQVFKNADNLDSPFALTTVTGANPMVVTTTADNDFMVGATIGFYLYGAAGTSTAGTYGAQQVSAEITVASVQSTKQFTTDYNNTVGAGIFNNQVCKQVAPPNYTAAIRRLGLGGKTIMGSNKRVLDIAGAGRDANGNGGIRLTGLTTYATDAAAGAGGVLSGEIYATSAVANVTLLAIKA